MTAQLKEAEIIPALVRIGCIGDMTDNEISEIIGAENISRADDILQLRDSSGIWRALSRTHHILVHQDGTYSFAADGFRQQYIRTRQQ